jgi:Fic family protein
MDGAECTKTKSFTMGGLKIIDPEMNRILMEQMYDIKPIIKEDREKRQSRGESLTEVRQQEDESRSQVLRCGVDTKETDARQASQKRRDRESRKNKKQAGETADMIETSFQSVLAILLVRFKIGKDNLDVNSR